MQELQPPSLLWPWFKTATLSCYIKQNCSKSELQKKGNYLTHLTHTTNSQDSSQWINTNGNSSYDPVFPRGLYRPLLATLRNIFSVRKSVTQFAAVQLFDPSLAKESNQSLVIPEGRG